jgi:enolase
MELSHDVYRAAGRLLEARGPVSGVADEGGWWPNFSANEDALDVLALAIDASGHHDVFIALDIAANELGDASGYRLALDGDRLTADAMADRIIGWSRRYPVLSIEDPAAEDDWETMARVSYAIGEQVQIVGDDVLVTSATRIAAAAQASVCNAALVKVNQAGTVTAAQEALRAAMAIGWGSIVSARSGESEDVTIAHLATGWDAGQLKVGSFSRSERMAKWNEMLRIEESMGTDARFAGATAFASPIGRRCA